MGDPRSETDDTMPTVVRNPDTNLPAIVIGQSLPSPLAGSDGPALLLKTSRLSQSAHLLEHAPAFLTTAEKNRAESFLRGEDRDRFVLGRIMVRSMLAAMPGGHSTKADFALTREGRPFISRRPDLSFSISHSGDVVLVGLAEGLQLGVDVEMERDGVEMEGVSRLVFTPAERRAIFQGTARETATAFFRHWTAKEAFLKAAGSGFLVDPLDVQIDLPQRPGLADLAPDTKARFGGGWRIAEIGLFEEYRAHVAWRSRFFK